MLSRDQDLLPQPADANRAGKPLAWITFPYNKIKHWLNRNSLSGSRDNISAHYDLGNDLYELFLDPQMQYSSAVFKHRNRVSKKHRKTNLKSFVRSWS